MLKIFGWTLVIGMVIFASSASAQMDKRLLPGLAEIGRGYDIFGLYADPESIKSQKLFDFGDADEEVLYDSSTYLKYGTVVFRELRRGHIDVVHGETIEDYSSSFSSKTKLSGSYAFFNAQLGVDFKEALERHREHVFTTVNGHFAHWLLALPESSKLIPMLNESARNDLNTMEPEKLFDKYGTHFVAEIVVGGRSKYSCATEKSKFESKFSIEFIAEASYRSSWSISGKEDAKYQSDISNFRENSHIVVDTIGGDPEYAHNIVEGSYDKWLKSTKNNPVWFDFGTERPLRPLWELCSSVDRQKKLESAYPQYAIDHSPIITVPLYQLHTARPDGDFFFWTNSEEAYIRLGQGWDPQGIVCRLLDRELLDARPLYILVALSGTDNPTYQLTADHNFYRDQQTQGWTGMGELGFVLPKDAKGKLKNVSLIPLYLLWARPGESPGRSKLTTDEADYKAAQTVGWSVRGRGFQGYVFSP